VTLAVAQIRIDCMTRGRVVARPVNQGVSREERSVTLGRRFVFSASGDTEGAQIRSRRRELHSSAIAKRRQAVWERDEFPRPSHKCYLRAERRRRQGPRARGAGRSVAKSLDEAEHRCTLADVMAESAHVIIDERALELQCDPR